MPVLNLGTYRLDESSAPSAITAALDVGYAGIDGARFYKNEHIVGKCLQSYTKSSTGGNKVVELTHIPEGMEVIGDFADTLSPECSNHIVFITTKIWPTHFEESLLKADVESHLQEMKREQTDLILLHWPGPHHSFENCTEEMQKDHETNEQKRLAMWRVLEDMYHSGKTRAIGVSNFMPQHLIPLMQDIQRRKAEGDPKATFVMCNQVEGSPWIQGFRDLEDYCRLHKIAIVCYRPLGGDATKYGKIGEKDVSEGIALRLGKPKANILIRWGLQKGFILLPKSSNPERIRSNLDVFSFSLSSEDMVQLDSLFEAKANARQNPYDIA